MRRTVYVVQEKSFWYEQGRRHVEEGVAAVFSTAELAQQWVTVAGKQRGDRCVWQVFPVEVDYEAPDNWLSTLRPQPQ